MPMKKDEPSSIAVMTHEKRIYSNKVLSAMDFSVPPPGFNASVPPPGLPPPTIPTANSSDNNDFNPAGDQSELRVHMILTNKIADPFHEYSEDNMMGGFEPTASAQWSLPPPAGEGMFELAYLGSG